MLIVRSSVPFLELFSAAPTQSDEINQTISHSISQSINQKIEINHQAIIPLISQSII